MTPVRACLVCFDVRPQGNKTRSVDTVGGRPPLCMLTYLIQNNLIIATYLLRLNLLNWWQLYFQPAIRTPSVSPSIFQTVYFSWRIPKSTRKVCSIRYSDFWAHHQWWLHYPCWLWSNYSEQILWHHWKFPSHSACISTFKLMDHDDGHTLDLMIFSSHDPALLLSHRHPSSPWFLPVLSQIFHFQFQILPAHPPFNWTNNHPIPLLQYHWCWQL